MINTKGFRDLSLSVFDSAFSDILKDDEVEMINEMILRIYNMENKTAADQSKVAKMHKALREDRAARRFFEDRNFYPWIEFLEVDEEYIFEKYRRFMGR